MAKVLIIEDDPLMLQMYRQAFLLQKYEVGVAENGKEALDKVRDFNPEVILLDIMMPVMNGIDVLTHLKADQDLADIPVIMLTNLSGTDDTATALSKGAIRYIVKSEHDPMDVVKLVKDILDNRKVSVFGYDSDPDPAGDN